MRAMTSSGMSFGQAASHSPWFVQPPKPSRVHRARPSRRTRSMRSGWPCGSSARCETLAPANSIADAFGQAATQAPQPMQAAASIARSASSFGTGIALASGAQPVSTEMKPPAAMIAVEGAAVDDQVLDHREGARAPRLDHQRRRRRRSCACGAGRWSCACAARAARPLITRPQVPQMPSRQSWSKAIGSSPLRVELLVDDVEHLEERHVGADVVRLVGRRSARRAGRVLLPPDVQASRLHYL